MADSTSVKDTLQHFITTIVQQQEQINTINAAMIQMSIDNVAAQEKLSSWTYQLFLDSQTAIQAEINKSNRQIKNISYNIQGFTDKNDISQQIQSVSFESIKPLPISTNVVAIQSYEGERNLLRYSPLLTEK